MFTPLVLKIAAEMIEQRLTDTREQQLEPVDQPDIAEGGQAQAVLPGQSALRFLSKDRSSSSSATEPAPKVVTTTGGDTDVG